MRVSLIAALLVGGCSVLDLGEDLVSTPCASDADCAHLEAITPTESCTQWQCDARRCHVAVDDVDDDGIPSALCTGSTQDDCDDANPSVSPVAVETTNGVDDDCDGSVDDVNPIPGAIRSLYSSVGHLRASPPTRTSANEGTSIALIESEVENGAGPVLFVRPDDSDTILPFIRQTASTETPVVAREIVATQLSTSTQIVAVVPDGDCRRVAIGFVEDLATPSRRMVSGFGDYAGIHFDRGLPNESGDDCSSPTSPTNPTSPSARSPSIASSGLTIAVAWLAANQVVDACDSVVDAPVLVHSGHASTTGIRIAPGASTRIGTTDDGSPPALVSIGEDEFLEVHVDDGAIVLTRILIGPDGVNVFEELSRIAVGALGSFVGRPRLALGRRAEDSLELAIEYVEGTCSSGTVTLRQFELVRASSTLIVRPKEDASERPTSDPSQTAVDEALVRSHAPDAFFPMWIGDHSLSIRGLDSSGRFFGSEVPCPVDGIGTIAHLRSVDALDAPPWSPPGLSIYLVATLDSGLDVLLEHSIAFP